MSAPVFDTLLLLALPASGKSEVRKFMREGTAADAQADYHLGETVQLDDFPYVHFLRCCDDALVELGAPRSFYRGPDDVFLERRDWGTLLQLVNQDYKVITEPDAEKPSADPQVLFDRIDAAREAVGASPVFRTMDAGLKAAVADKVAAEAHGLVEELFGRRPDTLEGKTVVIEFARGGSDGMTPPLPEPHGYAYSLRQLAPEILESAAILYIWVTPEESRRKNAAREDPDDPGSILHHSCPLTVMLADYGVCDMTHLADTSSIPGTVEIDAHGRTFNIPLAIFDNRVDLTSCLRDDPADWPADTVSKLRSAISAALSDAWTRYAV
jgi:hypothetical protein